MSDDLWGDLPGAATLVHPKSVLNEQATILAQKTSGLLTGDVRVQTSHVKEGDTRIDFSIVCPPLQNYRFDVLRGYYNMIEVYPIHVTGVGLSRDIKAGSAEEFKEAVAQIFRSDRVRTAIAALLRDASAD